jgi:Carboxypeptidase regulatory-like domain
MALTVITSLVAFSNLPVTIFSQTSYVTDFESPTFTLGNVQGQNGWGYLSNSPAKGIIETAPAGSPVAFGAQSLAVRTNDVGFFGVQNQLYSALVDPAGETGSTRNGVVVAAPHNQYIASFYYQAPATPVISTRADGRFAELNPSSKGTSAGDPANRYAQIRVINDTNTAAGKVKFEIGWYSVSTATFTVLTVAQNLNWGEWYRFDYRISLCDGLNGSSPNDTFRIVIQNLAGNNLGIAFGSTWESAWKTGTFGGGTTPRAINGFDFWTQTGPNNALVGYIDNFSESVTNIPNPCAAPTAASVSISGRVVSGKNPVSKATVTLIDGAGVTRTALTNAFGYYKFDDVAVGQTIILGTSAKGFQFAARALTVYEAVEDLNFIAQ